MALAWVRLDTQFHTNHKVMELVADGNFRAAFVYVASLAQCGQHETDGFIIKSWLPFVHANQKIAEQLVEVGLWAPTEGGWQIPDWCEYQPTSEQSAKRTEKAKHAAKVRWQKQRAKDSRASLKAVKP